MLNRYIGLCVSAAALTLVAGCPVGDVLADLEIIIEDSVSEIQVVDPRVAVVPVGLGQDIVLDASVDVVVDVSTDLIVEELPDITLLGFDNLTGFDVYLEFFAEDEFQSVLIFDGETLLLEYPCLADFELVTEEHFDVATGLFVEGFDLSGEVFFNPDDFVCGDAVIITFEPDVITVGVEIIDLVE